MSKAFSEQLLGVITVRGWKFRLRDNEDGSKTYECRGDVWYDDYGDEQVEPSLERAAFKLLDNLKEQGYEVEIEWSEKGWIGVRVS